MPTIHRLTSGLDWVTDSNFWRLPVCWGAVWVILEYGWPGINLNLMMRRQNCLLSHHNIKWLMCLIVTLVSLWEML